MFKNNWIGNGNKMMIFYMKLCIRLIIFLLFCVIRVSKILKVGDLWWNCGLDYCIEFFDYGLFFLFDFGGGFLLFFCYCGVELCGGWVWMWVLYFYIGFLVFLFCVNYILDLMKLVFFWCEWLRKCNYLKRLFEECEFWNEENGRY